jgi:hypothetical protein
MEPAGWGSVFDVRIGRIDPLGPATAGQTISGETGPQFAHLKLNFQMIEIDPDRDRLRLDVKLPFGITVHEDLNCIPRGVDGCRVDYRCSFAFPRGWRGPLAKVLLYGNFDSGAKDSLSRLKVAAERNARHATTTRIRS